MKIGLGHRLLSLVLSVLLLVGVLPVSAFAAQDGAFILVAEAGGELVIEPEYIHYNDGETVYQALLNSGHTFDGIKEGWITAIDGVTGNFKRSDEDGDYDLAKAADDVRFYRFAEGEDVSFGEGLQQLMNVMADYQEKSADVKVAAREEYQTACEQFVGITENSALYLAEELEAAVEAYENSQNSGNFTVTFRDGGSVCEDADILVKNTYGKEWVGADGAAELPAGEYSFVLTMGGLRAEGEFSLSFDMEVELNLPQEHWLNTDAFRLSGSYGADTNPDNQFTDGEFQLEQWTDRALTVAVKDTFTGTVYSYVEYNEAALDEVPTLTALYTSAQGGEEKAQQLPFESLTSGAVGALKKGAEGNTVIYRVSHEAEDGFLYSQDYTVHFERIPTLKAIFVKDQDGVDQTSTERFDGNVTEYIYKVVNDVTAVSVSAVPLDEDYEIIVNGKAADGAVEVALNEEGETVIDVTVSANGYSNSYQLTILPGEGKKLSFLTENQNVTLEVVNANGEVMPYKKFREGTNGNRYQYVLVPGETYSYVATENQYYHIADEFTMEDIADSTINVSVPTSDWLNQLDFGMGGTASKYKGNLPMDTVFSKENHSYHVSFVDTEHLAYVWVTAASGTKIQAMYNQIHSGDLYHGKEKTVKLDSGKTAGVVLQRFLMDENPLGNTVTIRLSKEVNGITQYQDYVVEFSRSLTLGAMDVLCDGVTASLVQEGGKVGFDSDEKNYSVTVSMAANKLELSMAAYTDNYCYGEDEIGYRILVNGEAVGADGKAAVELNGSIETEVVSVVVENDKAPTGSSTYTLNVLKSPPVETEFIITPEDAMLAVYETMSGERVWENEQGLFRFCEDYSYRYVLTCFGYVSRAGVLSVTRDENNALVIVDGDEKYIVSENETGGEAVIQWNLEEAPLNSNLDSGLAADWNNFRGNDNNNAVVSDPIPTIAEEGTLYWANQLGKGFDSDAVGSPIIVDGDLITYASDKIYRVDTVSGEIKATGTMDHKSSFSITPPTYAEGMVFVALSNGTVQAFNAKTLESLWLYVDPLGGQPNCPITVKDGYLYTGFWNSETGDANFVCMTVTDENPNESKESKCPSWYHTAKGGYYWAGAYASEDFVLIGTDDGTTSCTSPTSSFLMFDADNGRLLDTWEGLDGDIRSTVSYDEKTDAFYFTSKGGTFYSVQVKNDGGWKFANGWSVKLNNNSGEPPMSTCSPVVYNGRAYVGVSGSGQFAAYSGHNITVIDLGRKAIAYSVETQGYPQTSGLLTTAYEEESGYVYIYYFDNMTPGKLRVLRDKAGQTKADYLTKEGSHNAAYALFTPTGKQAQYAICSPISDEYGTIYFKNDSAYLMAFGSMIEKIEISKRPDKMTYATGESFDPTGMVVTATYANGKTRDVSDYISFNSDPLSAENNIVTVSFHHVMYHNEENGSAMDSGISTTTPVTTLTVKIDDATAEKPLYGDVNNDGEVDTIDASAIISYYYGIVEFSEGQLAAANVNGDGEVDTLDASAIISYYYGMIAELPC